MSKRTWTRHTAESTPPYPQHDSYHANPKVPPPLHAEVCILRPCDIETTGDIWLYQPESHKNQHHDQERVICLGHKAQDVLRPYLLREKTTYCSVLAESEKKRRAEQHARRVTPLHQGNRLGTNRKRKPRRRPGERYDTNTYRRAVHRGVDKANAARRKRLAAEGKEVVSTDLLPR